MRPATLAEATRRIVNGTPQEKALPEFLDTFYLASTDERSWQRLSTGRSTRATNISMHSLALLPSILRGNINWHRIPDWVFEPHRYLDHAWHVSQLDDPGMREYLAFASPAEFRSRNIFTEERPLRRRRAKVA